MKKTESINKGKLIKADIISRPNALSGKYKKGELGLENLAEIRDDDVFFLETLKMKADLADKMIADAELQGKNTSDINVMRELGEKINGIGQPLHRGESVMTAIFVSLQLMIYYGIALGIWGVVFKTSWLIFGLIGIIVGLVISLLFAAPVVAYQRTKARIKEISFSIGAIWGNVAIIIGIIGLIAWVIRLIFF